MIHLAIYVLMTSPLLVATLAPMAFHYSGYGNPTESPPPKGNHVVPSVSPITTTLKYTTISPIDHCRGQPDNYSAAEPGSKCRRYFRCNNNGRQSIYLCPGKLVFNGLRCVHPSEFHCHNSSSAMADPVVLPAPSPLPSPNDKIDVNGPKDCEGKSDGYYQDGESGCRSYFFCASGLKAIYVCPGKSVFDGQRCVEPETYKCPFSSSDCQGATNGYLADLSSGCRNYYFCSGDGHKLITLTCSDGRLFDGKKCVDPSQYRCPSDQKGSVHLDSYYAYSTVVRKPSQSYNPQTYFVSSRVNAGSTATTGQTPAAKGDYCERNYGFFVVHGTGCRQYYLCIGGSRSDLQCSGDAVFNGQICVDPDQYICPESKSDCQGKTDGVYPDRLSGCRNYFLCLGQVQTNLSCPAGQLFDGRRCTDGRRVSCTDPLEGRSAMTSSPCSGRTNGLYPDPSFPGCRGYLYCRAGRPYGPAGRCSRSERFSGQHSRCLPKHEVECSPEEDNEDEMDYMMAEGSALVTIIGEEDPAVTTAATTTN